MVTTNHCKTKTKTKNKLYKNKKKNTQRKGKYKLIGGGWTTTIVGDVKRRGFFPKLGETPKSFGQYVPEMSNVSRTVVTGQHGLPKLTTLMSMNGVAPNMPVHELTKMSISHSQAAYEGAKKRFLQGLGDITHTTKSFELPQHVLPGFGRGVGIKHYNPKNSPAFRHVGL